MAVDASIAAAIADRDGDRIEDSRDACPDVAGAPSTDATNAGCAGLLVVEGDRIRLLKPIQFEINKALIVPASLPVLDALGDALKALDCELVEIRAHLGTPDPVPRGLNLSLRRAESVGQALVQRSGISRARLQAEGYGATHPIVPYNDPRAMHINRRIELVLLECRRLGIVRP